MFLETIHIASVSVNYHLQLLFPLTYGLLVNQATCETESDALACRLNLTGGDSQSFGFNYKGLSLVAIKLLAAGRF